MVTIRMSWLALLMVLVMLALRVPDALAQGLHFGCAPTCATSTSSGLTRSGTERRMR